MKTKNIIILIMLVIAISLGILNLHFIKTKDAFIIGLKKSPSFKDTYIDVLKVGAKDLVEKERVIALINGKEKPLYKHKIEVTEESDKKPEEPSVDKLVSKRKDKAFNEADNQSK